MIAGLYPLQGTRFDVPTSDALAFSVGARRQWAAGIVRQWQRLAREDALAFCRHRTEHEEHRDLQRLIALPADAYLRLDERTHTRDVLMVGGPGRTHAHRTRHHRWQMVTTFGDLRGDLRDRPDVVRRRLESLFDPSRKSKRIYRQRASALEAAMAHFRQHYNVATAFPPCHARFFADRHLPHDAPSLVVDPCAGWGGRLVGTLLVERAHDVSYIGVDPNERNQAAYVGLLDSVRQVRAGRHGLRSACVHVAAFEDWLESSVAQELTGRADLVITSPPYAFAENYDAECSRQSANRYASYAAWRSGFYSTLCDGAFRLLKPGGTFVLNVADVPGAGLELDAINLARSAGFEPSGYFKLAMNVTPGTKAHTPRHWLKVDGKRWKFEPVFVWRKGAKS